VSTVAAFSSRWVELPASVTDLPEGGLAAGFRAAGVPAGIKPSGDPDLALLVSSEPDTVSAARFTRSGVLAAPVLLCQSRCRLDALRAVVVNSGNANAATGNRGLEDAARMQGAASMAAGVHEEHVAVASTGVIGVPLPMDGVPKAILAARGELANDGDGAFWRAIATTDAFEKRLALDVALPSGSVRISAQAKGAGMIQPGFATMLCFVQTDAQVAEPEAALRAAVADSFERITVDGQMSTNDTVLLQATGSSGRPLPAGLLDAVLLQLALEIVADGEGATRVGRIEVTGGASSEEAERVARAIANSPLVKTAFYGRDPNWGRIAQAAGMALAGEQLEELGPDAIEAGELGSNAAEAEIGLRLDRGDGGAQIYFSDLTPGYVELNSEYTT
jgi:glutamate N-acetyltransferase / amino-acid N-acetyltransferase